MNNNNQIQLSSQCKTRSSFRNDLIQKPFNLDFRLYEKNTMNRINFVSYFGKHYYYSVDDQYQQIRVIVVAVLTKIMEQYLKDANYQRIEIFKQFILHSDVSKVIQNKDILKENLFAHFLQELQDLLLYPNRLEMNLIRKINTQPFFDKIIMQSFRSSLLNNQNKSINLMLTQWIGQKLQISVVQNSSEVASQPVSNLYIYPQVQRQLKTIHTQSLTSITQVPTQMPTSPMLQSISSISSPTKSYYSKKKNYNQVKEFNQEDKENINKQQEIRIKVRYREKTGFWKRLCCGNQ